MADTFTQYEDRDGVRLTWNVWPNSKLDATRCVIPFAALYTPNKRLAHMPVLNYEPIPCKQCSAILNPYAAVDFNSKFWMCPFCKGRNHFPAHYQAISEQALPAELYPDYTTIEYTLASRAATVHPPAFLFLIDTCVAEDELRACKDAIQQAVSTLPDYTYVGLVTFGTHVHAYELGFSECSRCHVFKGTKEYSSAQVVDQLGLRGASARGPGAGGGQAASQATRRFLMPLKDCEFTFATALEELQKDAYPVATTQRPARCTGTAVLVATALLGASVPLGSCQARCLLFIGGPCTEGPGKVVNRDLTEEIRSHKHLVKSAAAHFDKAKKFYSGVAQELVAHGHAFDLFACALDQVGQSEMRDMSMLTNGLSVQTDSFLNPVFKESLKRMFAKEDEEGFLGLSCNATLDVIPSLDIKVAGLLGPAARVEKKSPHAAEVEVGLGGTTTWKMAGIDVDTTVAVLFEITANAKEGDSGGGNMTNQQFFLQFITRYMHWSGQLRCRVTTVPRNWVQPNNRIDLITGFDQEASAVLMARLACHKMDTEEDFDATRWLDRALIRLCQRFAEYQQDDSMSFSLRHEMLFYPQFMFNLRRSQFVQVFGNSPDETAYFRLLLFRVPVSDAILMIQPTLTAYDFAGPPQPVLLDVQSILPDRILLLDAFFYVVIFHGQSVAQWRKQDYQSQSEHAAFAQLLAAPHEVVKQVVTRRFPNPRIVDCDQYGSQARFLLARLNPSSTHSSKDPLSAEVINTDDVSLSTFTDHLKRLAVQS